MISYKPAAADLIFGRATVLFQVVRTIKKPFAWEGLIFYQVLTDA
ncbi:MAG: hypothetical protein ABIQ88_17320 [Chitinophagaceae bacterium]